VGVRGSTASRVRSRSESARLCRRQLRVALPLASRWYPPEHQGKAMGLAGMGNSGTVLASLFAPTLAKTCSAGMPCSALPHPADVRLLRLYLVMAKDAPNAPAPKPMAAYLQLLRSGRCLVADGILSGHLRWLFRARLVALRSTSPISSG
jgi:nitrate/nitrite transporter NarK